MAEKHNVNKVDKSYDEKFKIKDLALLKGFLKYFKPYQLKFVFFLFLSGISILAIFLEPAITGKFINDLNSYLTHEIDNLNFIYVATIHTAVMIIVFLVTMYFSNLGFEKIGQHIIYDIRADVFKKIEFLSIGQINSMPIGKFVTRCTNDTQSLSRFFTDIMVQFISNIIEILVLIVYVLVTNWQLGLIIIAFIPIMFLDSFFIRSKSRPHFRQIRNSYSKMNGFLAESLSGMKTIQIFNQQEKKHEQFNEINNKIIKHRSIVEILFAIYHPSIYFINMLCQLLVFLVGIFMISKSTPDHVLLQVGTLFSMYMYCGRLSGPTTNIAGLFNRIVNYLSSAEKVWSVLCMPTVLTDSPDAKTIDKFKGEIEFRNVSFAYIPDEWVLKNVSFKINANETAAFVGATGAGKSTIIQLIVRNYDVQEGEILIDGVNVKDIKLESLRRGVGQMLQDVFLFSGTIKDNIKLWDESITDEEIIQSCKYVGANSFIEKLPKQYDEEVRERGNNFSAGQKQLISFARVVAYKPDIVVLDEATANIDTETEVLIQDSLNKMRNIGTMIIVAHRLSTIKNVDKIYVLDHGKIVEQGNHLSLIKQKGLYYKLYELQNMQKQIYSDVLETKEAL